MVLKTSGQVSHVRKLASPRLHWAAEGSAGIGWPVPSLSSIRVGSPGASLGDFEGKIEQFASKQVEIGRPQVQCGLTPVAVE
jgi:hypothetical protein